MRDEGREERPARRVRMFPVDSAAIEAVGYDPDERTLYVRFHQTGTYSYFDVPPDVFRALLMAPSKGRFYNRYIRSAYAVGSRVPREEP